MCMTAVIPDAQGAGDSGGVLAPARPSECGLVAEADGRMNEEELNSYVAICGITHEPLRPEGRGFGEGS